MRCNCEPRCVRCSCGPCDCECSPEPVAAPAQVTVAWPTLSWSTVEAFRPILTDLAIVTPESNEEYAFRFEEYLQEATTQMLALRGAPPPAAAGVATHKVPK